MAGKVMTTREPIGLLFDYLSPYVYIACTQIHAPAERHDRRVERQSSMQKANAALSVDAPSLPSTVTSHRPGSHRLIGATV